MTDGRRRDASRQTVLLHDPSDTGHGPAATSATVSSTLQKVRRAAPTWLAVLVSLTIGLAAGHAASTLFQPVGGAALDGLWIDPPSPEATMASTFDADRDQAPTPSDTPTPEALTTEPARIVGPTDSGGRPLPPASAPPGPPPVGAASPLSDTGDADVEDRPPVRPNRPEADDDLHDGEHEDAEQQVGGEDHEPSGHEDSPEPPGAHDQPASAEVEAPAQEVEEPGREPEEHGDGHSQSEDDVSQEDPEPSGSRPDEDVGDRPESTTELEDPDHGDGDAQRPGHEEESEED